MVTHSILTPENFEKSGIILYGLSSEGNTYMVHIENFRRYFYIECFEDFTREQFIKIKPELMTLIFGAKSKAPIYESSAKQSYTRPGKDIILVYKESFIGFKGKSNNKKFFLKVLVDCPNNMYDARRQVEDNVFELGQMQISRNLFEDSLPFVLRYMVDHTMSGMSWVSLPKQRFKVLEDCQQSISGCQQELVIDYKNMVSRDFTVPRFSQIASMRIMSFDIECYAKRGFPMPEENPIITIGIYCQNHEKEEEGIRVILQLDTCEPIIDCHLLTFKTEKGLLKAFTDFFRAYDPDIITGYNIQNFDLNYTVRRMEALKMTPPTWGRRKGFVSVTRDSKFNSKIMGFRETKDTNINGRTQMDMMIHMLKEKKFGSYSLNNVSFQILGQQKEDVPHKMISVLQDSDSMGRKRLASYCLKDSILPMRLLNSQKCVYNYIEMARVTGVPMNYLFSRGQQIKVISQIQRDIKSRGLLVPGRNTYHSITKKAAGGGEDFGGSESKTGKGFQGAFVLDPKPGFYLEPIATLDFASLYPSIMIRHNLCYTTIIYDREGSGLSSEEIEVTPEGYCFAKSSVQKGILPGILEKLLSSRKSVKYEMKVQKKTLKKVTTRLKEIEEIEEEQERLMYSDGAEKENASKANASKVSKAKGSKSRKCLKGSRDKADATMQNGADSKIEEESNHENHQNGNTPIEEETRLMTTTQMAKLTKEKQELSAKSKTISNNIAVMDGRQLALKISANSVYGFTGAQKGHLPCLEIAGSVTAFGRRMIEHTRDKVEDLYTMKNGYKCDADVIYGDTDSVMIKFGGLNLADCMELGKKAANRLTEEFDAPIKLEFEKVYHPYLLLSKKRYAGNYWTNPIKPDKKECKGLESVRRDNCLMIRNMIEKVIDILLNDKDTEKAKRYVQGQIYDLQNGNIDISKLIISKGLTKALDYEKIDNARVGEEKGIMSRSKKKNGKKPADIYKVRLPHVSLAERLYKRNPNNPPMSGDRIPYVVIKGHKKAPLYERTEDPLYALERDLPLDIDYYLERQIKAPVKRIFKAIDPNYNIFSGDHTSKIKGQIISSSKGIGMFFGKAKAKCLICKKPLENQKSSKILRILLRIVWRQIVFVCFFDLIEI